MKFEFIKNKLLFFNVEVTGLNTEALQYLFSITINDVIYGFKGVIDGNRVKIEVPAFSNIVKNIENGKSYEAKLEVNDGKFYMCPWQDSASFDSGPNVKVKLTTEKEARPVEKVKVSLSSESSDEMVNQLRQISNDIKTSKKSVKEDLDFITIDEASVNFDRDPEMKDSEELVSNRTGYSDGEAKLRGTKEPNSLQVEDGGENIVSPSLSSDGTLASRNVQDRLSGRMSESTKNPVKKPVKDGFVPKSQKDLIFFLESCGMRTPSTQEKMLERAKELGGEEIEDQYKTLKKMLGKDKPQTTFDLINKLNARRDK